MSERGLNYLNIFLMGVACVVAFYLPFELFLFSYAILGPLHYLTEISWLHDRKYFTSGKYDYLFLLLPAIPLTIALGLQIDPGWPVDALLVGLAFGGAAGMVLFPRTLHKCVLGFVTLFICLIAINFPSPVVFLSLFLPTVVHVFIFTGAFILYGTMKSRSITGFISFMVFLLCGAIFFLVTPPAQSYIVSDYVRHNISFFDDVNLELIRLFGREQNWDTIVATMRFLAFAYTYHYLNWFSKTKIIRWHNVSTKRIALIATLYVASVGLYAIDYGIGFVCLFFLSLAHVLLEFPLNHRSFVGIFQEGRLFLREMAPRIAE